MANNFREFPEPPRNNLEKLFDTMNDLKQELTRLSTRLSNSRQSFKQILEDFFQQPNKNPFPTDGTIEADIEQYTKLVSYCLEAGDTDILDRWGIQNIRTNPAILASKEYDLYYLAFNRTSKKFVYLDTSCGFQEMS